MVSIIFRVQLKDAQTRTTDTHLHSHPHLPTVWTTEHIPLRGRGRWEPEQPSGARL